MSRKITAVVLATAALALTAVTAAGATDPAPSNPVAGPAACCRW